MIIYQNDDYTSYICSVLLISFNAEMILFRVYKLLPNGKEREVLRNNIPFSPDIDFDFSLVLRAMNLLFPKHIVEFRIM